MNKRLSASREDDIKIAKILGWTDIQYLEQVPYEGATDAPNWYGTPPDYYMIAIPKYTNYPMFWDLIDLVLENNS